MPVILNSCTLIQNPQNGGLEFTIHMINKQNCHTRGGKCMTLRLQEPHFGKARICHKSYLQGPQSS